MRRIRTTTSPYAATPVSTPSRRAPGVTARQFRGMLRDFTAWSAEPAPCLDPSWSREGRRATWATARTANSAAATLLTDPDGRPALLVSPFVLREEAAPGEEGRLARWRES
ncbi:hypothetical protein ACFWOX_04655 [Streptomyces sp. NPDC058467]|uniref:hypothetical protein n=1 Tax=Streptomyces sp. NPDC058467 TaxID=3346513 RepID=UPI00366331BE